MASHPTDPGARMADLMRQGFMKPRKVKLPTKAPPPIIACNDCLNWHPRGKHTADAATRKANRARGGK